jgi:hypothetical protein
MCDEEFTELLFSSAKEEPAPAIVDGEEQAAPAAGELPPLILTHLQGQIVKDGESLKLECCLGGKLLQCVVQMTFSSWC